MLVVQQKFGPMQIKNSHYFAPLSHDRQRPQSPWVLDLIYRGTLHNQSLRTDVIYLFIYCLLFMAAQSSFYMHGVMFRGPAITAVKLILN